MDLHAPWLAPAVGGPFRADQVREGDAYEVSNGQPIQCMTTGGRHGRAQTLGGTVLGSDPAVKDAVGIDVGISWNDGKTLRAPDVVVGVNLQNAGWVKEAPPLAVEYADVGQDEAELAIKIRELLAFGTQLIWVVRLQGELRVEVHEFGQPLRVVPASGQLEAPGILQNPVPVRALIDPEAAHEATLRNLLGRKGYADLDHVQQAAREEGQQVGLATVRSNLLRAIEHRGWALTPAQAARIDACTDLQTLLDWLTRAVTVASLGLTFEPSADTLG